MKTLILIGVLFALVLIATKKPDQSAFDAAQELMNKSRSIVPKIDEYASRTTHPGHSRSKAVTSPRSYKAYDNLPNSFPSTSTRPENDHEPGFKPFELEKLGSLEIEKAEIIASPANQPKSLEALPEISISALPEPVTAQPETNVFQQQKLRADVNYDDVKAYYENAARLLEEIR
tara:strand:- start:394 stop:918 length:525 start_codon:yes stop_codon:yes gene_type:complete